MRKVAGHLSAVAGRMLFIGFSLQILLGLAWICGNITHVQQFGDGFLFMPEAGLSLQVCATFWYLFQLAVAFFAGDFFLKAVSGGKLSRIFQIWGSLVLVTIPTNLQCHLALLPHSLVSSLLLCQLAFVWKAVREKDFFGTKNLAGTLICWLLLACLAPQYRYLGAVPVLFLFLYGFRRLGRGHLRKAVYQALLLCTFTGLVLGMGVWGRSGNRVREPEHLPTESGAGQTFAEAMFHRFAWTTVLRDWNLWPEELKAAAGDDLLWSAALYTDNVTEELQPYLTEQLGQEAADALYLDVAEGALKQFPGQILKEMAWDAFAYSVPPVGTRLFLKGRGYDSGCPRNYDIMRRETPVLTQYVMDYGCWWFGVALVLAAFLTVAGAFVTADASKKTFGGIGYAVLAAVATGALMVLWYTFQGAGILDVKNTIALAAFWAAWMVTVCHKAVVKEK